MHKAHGDKMKIGFQTSKYDNLTLKEELEFAIKQNVDFFDIFFDEWLPNEITTNEHKLINKLKNDNFPFTVHLPISTPKLSENDLSLLLEFIKELRPVTATVHFDKLTFELLEHISNKIKDFTTISIENTIPDNHSVYQENYLAFMKKAVKIAPIQATFDTGHCHANHYSLIQTVNELCDNGINIATVHAHDNDGTRDAHDTIGNGNIDFASFFKLLKEKKQNPMIVIEHWTDNITSLERLRNLVS